MRNDMTRVCTGACSTTALVKPKASVLYRTKDVLMGSFPSRKQGAHLITKLIKCREENIRTVYVYFFLLLF